MSGRRIRSTKRGRRADWQTPVLAGATAAIGAALSGPVVRRIMIRQGIIDRPNTRSSHTAAIPRGGGWAYLTGMALGSVTGRMMGTRLPVGPAAGVLGLALTGFADDRWDVPAPHRLAAQATVGIAADISSGQSPLGLVLVPALVNVVNFMDGIDGITALTAAVWGGNAVRTGIRTGNEQLALSGALAAGAAFGFLPHNLRPNGLFLGDIGSYLIGATIATATLDPALSWRTRAALLSPLVPYLGDTGLTVTRRALRGQNILQAHREHWYQKLANEHGIGHLRTAVLYAALAAACALVATLTLRE